MSCSITVLCSFWTNTTITSCYASSTNALPASYWSTASYPFELAITVARSEQRRGCTGIVVCSLGCRQDLGSCWRALAVPRWHSVTATTSCLRCWKISVTGCLRKYRRLQTWNRSHRHTPVSLWTWCCVPMGSFHHLLDPCTADCFPSYVSLC